MTDYEIILKIEAMLSVELERLEEFSEKSFEHPAYYVNGQGDVTGFAVNNMFAINISALLDLIRQFKSLVFLNVSSIGLSELDVLLPFQSLRELDVSNSRTKDISVLQHIPFLEKLNISNNQITDLSPIKNHQSLNELNASGNLITDISALRELTSLQELDVSYNSIEDISSLQHLASLKELYLDGNIVGDISVLTSLISLQSLGLFATKINGVDSIKGLNQLKKIFLGSNGSIDLSSLPEFESLEGLYLGAVTKQTDNFISSFYSGDRSVINTEIIEQLIKLRFLDLSDTSLDDITFLKGLHHLERLYLNKNQITDISPVSELKRLRLADFSSNKIKVLPSWITTLDAEIEYNEYPSLDKSINLYRNPIKTPPLSIVKQGKKAIEDYFKQIEKDNGKIDYLFEIKLLVIGEGGTGKTTFTRKIQNADADTPEERDTTLGIEVNQWNFSVDFPKIPGLGKADFHVNLWDFGGQKIYQGTHQMFFSDKAFYVLLADTREQKTDFSYWLNTVEQLAGDNSSLVIVLNKKFGHEQKFDETGFRNRFGKLIKDVVELDLKNDKTKMLALQDNIIMSLKQIPGIGDPLPPSWVKIRQELSTIKENFISFDRFRSVCAKHSISEQSMIYTVSNYFTKIGAFTHYIDNPVLHERIYLNSNWLVKTIYEVLDNETVKARKGRLSEPDIKIIWANNELTYEVNKLTELMHKFGLMYHIPFSDEYVVPSHLPTETPYQNWQPAGNVNLLHFIYEFDKYMPQGIMSRLIVALHHHIQNHDLVWHRGLNIELNGAHAEIIESYGGSNRFEIRIAGMNKTELLAVIRERFADVLKPFTKLNYKQLVPCICDECRASAEPAFHDYNLLLKFIEKKTGSQCSRSGEMISAEELLKILSAKPKIQTPEDGKAKLKTIKIFLASSKELEADRKELRNFFSVENDRLHEDGIYLKLIQWEHFIDAMSKEGLQNEYNKAARECDLFLSLFFIKVGKYTAIEFKNAFGGFKQRGRPLIYTYFKKPQINLDDVEEEDFTAKKKFEKMLKESGHYKTNYDDIHHLKNLLKEQLDMILPKMIASL